MKRFFTLLAALAVCLSVFGQAQITTRKEKLSDFGSKTMKVVLTGNSFLDEPLREAAKNAWYLSPFETCTAEEFDRLKTSGNHYFLLLMDVRGKKDDEDAGLTFVTLLKGEPSAKTVGDMMEVVRLPLCAAGEPSGREPALLPALLENIQSYVSLAMTSDLKGFGSVVTGLKRVSGHDAWIVEDELSAQVDDAFRDKYSGSRIHIVGAEEADAVMLDGEMGLVGFAVAPASPVKGTACYKYLIDVRTHEICYFKKHKIGAGAGAGFLKSDLSTLAKAVK